MRNSLSVDDSPRILLPRARLHQIVCKTARNSPPRSLSAKRVGFPVLSAISAVEPGSGYEGLG